MDDPDLEARAHRYRVMQHATALHRALAAMPPDAARLTTGPSGMSRTDLYCAAGVFVVALIFAMQIAHGLTTDEPSEALAKRTAESQPAAVKVQHQAAQKRRADPRQRTAPV